MYYRRSKKIDIQVQKCLKYIFKKYLMYIQESEIILKQEILISIYQKNTLRRHCIGHFRTLLYILLYKFRTRRKSWVVMHSESTHFNVWWEISNYIFSFARIRPVFELCFPVILLWSGTWEENHQIFRSTSYDANIMGNCSCFIHHLYIVSVD